MAIYDDILAFIVQILSIKLFYAGQYLDTTFKILNIFLIIKESVIYKLEDSSLIIVAVID